MNYFIYAGVFCFGALALIIEARRNYRESLRQAPFKTHPILEDAKIDELCTPTDGLTGFIIYSLLYLVSYVVILSSAELYDLVRSANLAKLEVGATTDWEGLGKDAFNLKGTEYAKPIFVSAFLIAAMSLTAMRPIENTMRSAAHRLAGIPRGVYRVIDALQTKSVMDQMSPDGPLTSHFEEAMRQSNNISDIGNYQAEVVDALRAIDTIYPVISPNNRARHFPIDDVEKLDDMSDKLAEDMRKFRAEVENFTPTKEMLTELHNRSFGIANDTKALFAVHYIRNHRSVKNIDISERLTSIVHSIDRNYNPEKNSLAAAALATSLICTFLVGALYYGWADGTLHKYPGGAKKEVREAWLSQPMSVHHIPLPATKDKAQVQEAKKHRTAPFVRPIECIKRHAQGRIAFGPMRSPTSSDNAPPWADEDSRTDQQKFNKTCATTLKSGTAQHLRNTHVDIFNRTLWDVFQGLLVALAAVTTAITTRAARLEQASWKRDWTLNRIPFLRLFGACLLPSLVALIAATTGELAQLLVEANFSIPQSALVRFFNNNMTFLLMMMPLGFILAFGTIVIMDRHASHSKEATVLIFGGLTAICVLGVLWLVIFVTYTHQVREVEIAGLMFSDRVRDLIILASVPITFILFFALFIEVTEETELDENNQPISDSVIVRFWQRRFSKRATPAAGQNP